MFYFNFKNKNKLIIQKAKLNLKKTLLLIFIIANKNK